MADSIEAETLGIPSAVVAVEQLARTTGIAMARVHGYEQYPIVQITGVKDLSNSLGHDKDENTVTNRLLGGQAGLTRITSEIASVFLWAKLPEE